MAWVDSNVPTLAWTSTAADGTSLTLTVGNLTPCTNAVEILISYRRGRATTWSESRTNIAPGGANTQAVTLTGLTASKRYECIAALRIASGYSPRSNPLDLWSWPMSTCIQERIVAAVLAALDELVSAGTLLAAKRPANYGMPMAPRDLTAYLYQSPLVEATEQIDGFKVWIMPLSIALFKRTSGDTAIDTSINNLRASVEQKLREEPTCGGLADDLRIRAPDPFAFGDAFAGAIVNVEVLFKHLEDDPFSQTV